MGLLFFDHVLTDKQSKQEAKNLRLAVEFFQQNVDKQISFSIGNSWHHVTVLAVNPETAEFQYSESGMPNSKMEIKYIDKYQLGN